MAIIFDVGHAENDAGVEGRGCPARRRASQPRLRTENVKGLRVGTPEQQR